MAGPFFYGRKIVSVCFPMALFSWGIGFYGPGIYLVSFKARHGWSTSLILSAITTAVTVCLKKGTRPGWRHRNVWSRNP